MYISEKIGDEYKTWGTSKSNRYILFDAGTGTGKTHFILNKLLPFCKENGKRILYFCNRRALKNQIKNDIPKELKSAIDVVMYQGYTAWVKKLDALTSRFGPAIKYAFCNSLNKEGNYFCMCYPIINEQIPIIDEQGIVRFEYFDYEKNRWNYALNKRYKQFYNGIAWVNPIIVDGRTIIPTISGGYICYSIDYDKDSIFYKLKSLSKFRLISEYDYVVMDEIHYMIQDATFNFSTYDFLEFFQKSVRSKQTLIFMSGTTEGVMPVLQRWANYIQGTATNTESPITIYKAESEIEISADIFTTYMELIDLIHESGKEKWLIFVDSKANGKKIEKMINESYSGFCDENGIRHCKFICSGPDAREDIIVIEKNKKFSDVRCLISTSVLDNGVSFIDPDLKNIAIETWDNTEFIQMAGRKRAINSDDKLKLYVKDRDYKELDNYVKKLEKRQKMLYEFNSLACNNIFNIAAHIHPSWKDKFNLVAKYCNNLNNYKEINGCVKFNGHGFKVNKLAILKTDKMLEQFDKSLLHIEKTGSFADYQLSLINKSKKQAEGIQNPFFVYIKKILKEQNRLYEKEGYIMDNDALKKLKIRLNEAIKVINSNSRFAMKKVNSTSNTLATSKWIIGAGIPYAIFYLPRDSHTKKPRYAVLELNKEEYDYVLGQLENDNTEVLKLSSANFELPDT